MLGEVAPLLVPQFDALLVSLLVVCAALVCLGIITVLHDFSRAVVGGVAGLLGHIPGLGKVLASPVNAVVHWMDHVFGEAERGLDLILARFLHSLGELVRWLGREIRAHADLLYLLSTVALGPAALRYLERLIAYARAHAGAAEHAAARALRRLVELDAELRHWTAGRIGAAIHAATAPLAGELDWLRRHTLGRLGAIERELGGIVSGELNGLREWAHRLADQYEALWHRVRGLERSTTAEGAAAVVAVGLTALGARWITCRNWRGIGRAVCGMPLDLVEAFLAGAIEALIVTDICELANIIEAVAVEVQPVLDEFVNAQAFICLAGGADYPSGIVRADLRGGGGMPSGIVAADLAA